MSIPGTDLRKDLLWADTTKFEDVLALESSEKWFCRNDEQLVDYFVKHYVELLDYALLPEISDLSTHAFNIITAELNILTKQYYDKNLMEKAAEKVFEGNPTPVQIFKLANILQMLFRTDAKKAADMIPIISQFIRHCSHNSVHALFVEMLKSRDEDQDILPNFISSGIPHMVVEVIRETDKENVFLIAGLFHLVRLFSQYPSLREIYQRPEVIKELFIEYIHTSLFVLNEQWDAICQICSENCDSFFADLVPTAIENITKDSPRFSQYQVSCIDFLTKMLNNKNVVTTLLTGIEEVIILIIKKYPNHSIALNSLSRFIVQVSSVEELGQTVMMKVLPLLSVIFMNRKDVVTTAISWKVLSDLCDKGGEQEKAVKSLDEVVIKQLNKFNEIVKAPYGGDLPQNEPMDNDLANEKILNLIRLFVMKR